VWIIVPRAPAQHARLALARKTVEVYGFLKKGFKFFKKFSKQNALQARFAYRRFEKQKSVKVKREKCRAY
jgi:hypothetical protein